jgi:rhamnose utilization protein RhaD (predicted bifunctional aldolase and dehydrogenase)
MGENLWRDADAQKYIDQYAADGGAELALRVYTSQLLGKQVSLVLHGGGNTSVKLRVCDSLGDEVEVVAVKGYVKMIFIFTCA